MLGQVSVDSKTMDEERYVTFRSLPPPPPPARLAAMAASQEEAMIRSLAAIRS